MIRGRRVVQTAAALAALVALSACDNGTLSFLDRNGSTTEPPDREVPDPPDIERPPDKPDVQAALAPARLLTRYEFDNAVSDLLGYREKLTDSFPGENLAGGFENNAYVHKVSPLYLRQLMSATEGVAERAMRDHRDAIVVCPDAQDGTLECGRAILGDLVERAFRRPPTDEEMAIYDGLFERALEAYGFDEALGMTLQALIQSPQFLYRMEFDDGMMPGSQKIVEVGPFEMASRLSFFLWAAPPDRALLDAAKADELRTDEQIQAQVRRMLDDPKAKSMAREFYRQWLHLKSIDSIARDATIYPEYTDELNADWRMSLDAFIDHVMWEEGTFASFYTSDVVYVTQAMAQMEGGEVPADQGGMMRTRAPEGQRAGVLTQPALMAMLAYPNQPSPIQRGVFVREVLLCQDLPDPPDDVDLTPPDPRPGATSRELFAELTKEDACADCHALINPVGFGFEHYDALGRWRATDGERPVDATGSLLSSPDPEINGDFDGAIELAERFSTSSAARSCAANRWMTFALGRNVLEVDEASVDQVMKTWEDGGWRWADLLEAIALSDAFRHRLVVGYDMLEQDQGG